MKSLNLFVLALFALFIASCGNQQEQEKKQLEDEIMKVHDEVMPEMQTAEDLKSSIQKIVVGFAMDSTVTDSSIIEHAKQHIEQLDEANNRMMDWMAAYQPPNQTNEDAIGYLKDQSKSVNEMAEFMKGAIADAQAFVEEHKNLIAEESSGNDEAMNHEHEHSEHDHSNHQH